MPSSDAGSFLLIAAPESELPPIPWAAWTSPAASIAVALAAPPEAPAPICWFDLIREPSPPERSRPVVPDEARAVPRAPASPSVASPSAPRRPLPAAAAADASTARELAAIARATADAQRATADAHALWLAMAMPPPWSPRR